MFEGSDFTVESCGQVSVLVYGWTAIPAHPTVSWEGRSNWDGVGGCSPGFEELPFLRAGCGQDPNEETVL